MTKNKSEKSWYFLTYDTIGFDWTIRLWDMNRGDQLVSSFTCPSRIISLDANVAPFYFDESLLKQQHQQSSNDEFLIVASLYGLKSLLFFKLSAASSPNGQITKKSSKEIVYQDSFSSDKSLNGLHNDLEV